MTMVEFKRDLPEEKALFIEEKEALKAYPSGRDARGPREGPAGQAGALLDPVIRAVSKIREGRWFLPWPRCVSRAYQPARSRQYEM